MINQSTNDNIYFFSISSAHSTWLTQHADVVDSDVDGVIEAVAVVDPVEEAARTRRKNGAYLQIRRRLFGLLNMIA
jgi:hypothetical protein